jgi:hypothetical protein
MLLVMARARWRARDDASARWLLAGSASTATAVNTGDDSRFIDATTAAEVDIPAPPTALGQRRFTLMLPDTYETAVMRSRCVRTCRTGNRI